MKLKPTEISYADAVRIYAEAGKTFGLVDAKLPLTEARFRASLSPEGMVRASKGMGGPQPAEVQRMLDGETKRLAEDQRWTREQRTKLAQAQARLEQAFRQLMQ